MANFDINKLKIRPAEAKDVAKIAEIEKETSPEPWSEESLGYDVTANERALVIIAEYPNEDGTLHTIAYADVWVVYDELQLNNIAVVEEYRGNRIAEIMLEILAHSGNELGCNTMNLEVRRGNTSAITLYKRFGFEQVGVRESYYNDNGEDALLFDVSI